MSDLSMPVKAAILARLEQHGPLTAIVPANRIYPMQPPSTPAYPFIRYSASVRAYEHSCGEGVLAEVQVHGFGRDETETHQIAAAVVAALDDAPDFFACDWIRTQFVPDGGDVWHAIIDFTVVHTT